MASPAQGRVQVKQQVDALHTLPTVAIGGISLANAKGVLQTGVGSVTIVSAITQAEDWRQAVAEFQQLIEQHTQL